MTKRPTKKRTVKCAKKTTKVASKPDLSPWLVPDPACTNPAKPIRDVLKLPKVGKFARTLAWIMRKHPKSASDSPASIIPHPASNPSAHPGKRAHTKEGSC